MNQITPSIRLLTYQESLETGLQIKALILEHNGNNYHLHGGTRDSIHVFQESIALYVLSINSSNGTIGLNAFMSHEPDAINTLFMHNHHEITEYLGDKWEQLKAETIVKKLIQYLY